jgi:hypothetical protein
MNPLLLGPLADIIKGVIGRIWPDPQQQADAQYRLAQLVQSGQLAELAASTDLAKAQIGVNQAEAASDSLFKGGWRPFIGWTCGSALAWNFIVRPGIVCGMAIYGHPVALPPADMSELMPTLLGMLGLGTLRTVEKIKGAA